MSLPKVIITDFVTEPLDFERGVLDGIAEVVALGAMSEEELVGKIEEADAVMCYHYLSLTRPTIERLENCKVIVRPGVGYDNVDYVAARERGIPVCNVPDYGTEEVADSALGMALTLGRGTHFLNSRLRRRIGDWSVEQATPIRRLRGRVFGIVGCGRIGSAVALRAKSFGFDVVFYDPYLPDGIEKSLGVGRVDTLGDLLAQSYILSLHCPLTEETRGMIGAEEIAKMAQGTFLINAARGGIVDTAAVVDALTTNHLRGAGIDVLEQEPPAEDSPVLKAWRDPDHPAHDRLLLNPHAAFYCDEGGEEFRTKGAREVQRALRGEPLRNVVN
jgi:D-3-phosphoglycerate dehydrogenase/C-terminal binding protein